MRDLNVVAEQLFNKIRGRFPSVSIGDGEGNTTNEPSQARFYEFDFKSLDNVLGKVSVSLDEKSGVTIMYNKDFTEEVGYTEQEDWYNFLKGMRVFAKKRLLNFEVRDINKSNFTQRDYSYMATNRGETAMNESALRGTDKTSFQKIGNAKLRIKHTGPIGEGESRTKKIGSLFIENAEGEKFKYPFKHLSGARAMAIHVSEGGHPFDDFGKHITGLSEELSNLRKFKTYMGRSSVMAESLAEHMDTVNERIVAVKKTIQNLQKPSNYKTAFESFEPSDAVEVPEEVAENWIDQLTVKQFNEELKDVFPYIYKLVGESTKANELAFEDIINELDSSPRPKLRPPMSNDVFPSEQAAIDDAMKNGYQQQGDDFEIVKVQGRMFAWRQIGDDIDIGAGSQRGPEGEVSTRGVNTESAIDAAFDKLLGQFADNFSAQVEGDMDEGNAYAKAVRMAKFKGAKKGDEIDGPDGKKITIEKDQKTPLGEFILSYFDRQTGQFPKGETAVLTSVEKDYGDQYVKPASQFIERLGQAYSKYQQKKLGEVDMEENFLSRMIGAEGVRPSDFVDKAAKISQRYENLAFKNKIASDLNRPFNGKQGGKFLLKLYMELINMSREIQKLGGGNKTMVNAQQQMSLIKQAMAGPVDNPEAIRVMKAAPVEPKFIIDFVKQDIQSIGNNESQELDEAGQELGNLIKTGVSGAYKYIEKTIRDFEVLLQQNPNHPKAQQYRQELEQLKKMLANAQMQMGESVFKKAKILEAKQEIYRIKQLAEAATAADANALTQAVKDFQTAAGLQADGIVGPQTKEAHKAAMANSIAAIDNKMNADAAATRDPNSPQAPGDAPAQGQQDPAPAQGQQDPAPAPNAKTAGQGQFERSVQVGQQVYANDADAISALMGKGARTQEEEMWLRGKAKEYGFYGNQAALPGILDKIRKGAAAQDAADDAAAVDGDPATAQPRAQGASNANYPSMAAAMQKVDYWEPGEQVTIAGQPHVRDVDAQGNKIFRPVNQQGAAPAGAAAPAAAPLPGSGGPRTRGGRRGSR